MLRLALAILGAALLAETAGAEGFSLYDLGEMPSREACLERAGEVLQAYASTIGAQDIALVDWAAYAYDLQPGAQDVTIMCPSVQDGVTAVLVVYGEDTEENRYAAGDELQRLWGG